jgi:hypothetical protein
VVGGLCALAGSPERRPGGREGFLERRAWGARHGEALGLGEIRSGAIVKPQRGKRARVSAQQHTERVVVPDGAADGDPGRKPRPRLVPRALPLCQLAEPREGKDLVLGVPRRTVDVEGGLEEKKFERLIPNS